MAITKKHTIITLAIILSVVLLIAGLTIFEVSRIKNQKYIWANQSHITKALKSVTLPDYFELSTVSASYEKGPFKAKIYYQIKLDEGAHTLIEENGSNTPSFRWDKYEPITEELKEAFAEYNYRGEMRYIQTNGVCVWLTCYCNFPYASESEDFWNYVAYELDHAIDIGLAVQ